MEELLTPLELASLLRIPQKTLSTWRTRGGGPTAVRVGRHLRYRAADVALWLENRAANDELNR